MKTKHTISNLFPIPIYTTNIDREFTVEEIDFVKQQKNDCYPNAGNITTNNSYILDKSEFKNINKFLKEHCQNYLEDIICPKDKNLKLYITQSWLNYTETNQYHHKHHHPNSIVSGVLYFDTDKEKDKITFFNSEYKQIVPEVDEKKYNLFNSLNWYFPVKKGDLIMFPSSLVHQVETHQATNTRISLSFNTFYKGIVGSNSRLEELIL